MTTDITRLKTAVTLMNLPTITLFLLAALVSPMASLAQDATGRIFGTVYDQQGAVIPGVQHHRDQHVPPRSRARPLPTMTDRFQVLALPIGNYKVKAEHDGFRTVVSAEQKLFINQALRIDIKMEVGSARVRRVDVGAEAAPVETVNATLGQSVTGRVLTNMPLNGRDMLDLALLQPGVTESNDDNGGAGNYSIAGGRTDSVTFLLDGGLNNDLLDNSNLLDPNPDAVAEFRLLTSNYTAEYGRNGGGIISVVTKSGTNQLHGSAVRVFPKPGARRQRLLQQFRLGTSAARPEAQPVRSHAGWAHRQGQVFLLPGLSGATTTSG